MLHLTIPQIGEETKNTKDLVFTILSSEQPLSIIQIYNKILTLQLNLWTASNILQQDSIQENILETK
mgnify:CR=1 FL=1